MNYNLLIQRWLCYSGVFVYLFLLIYCSPNLIFSQTLNIEFEQISSERGLSQSFETCILQDSKVFIWFETADGLNRYDGYNFKIYKTDPNVDCCGAVRTLTIKYNGATAEQHEDKCRIFRRSYGPSAFKSQIFCANAITVTEKKDL